MTMKKLRLLGVLFLTVCMTFSLTSCALLDTILSGDKEYRYQELVLTLDSSFTEIEAEKENRTTFVSVSGTAVIVIKESFESMEAKGIENPEALSLEDYRDAFNMANDYNGTIEEIDGLTAFTYNNFSEGTNYKLLVCVYRSETAFWSLQFMSLADEYDENEKEFINWAKKVTFDE